MVFRYPRKVRLVPDTPKSGRHRNAADTHEAAANRHDEAAKFWVGRGDAERADLERRNAAVERAAAEIERDRAKLLEREGR